MKKAKLTRRIVAVTASVALATGIFAAAPLSADAAKKTNYSHSAVVAKSPTRTALDVNGI